LPQLGFAHLFDGWS